jgi:hypothetical protein
MMPRRTKVGPLIQHFFAKIFVFPFFGSGGGHKVSFTAFPSIAYLIGSTSID